MKLNLAYIGFGNVGQGLTEILVEKRNYLKEKYNFEYNVVSICDKLKGSIHREDGLDLEKVLSITGESNNLEDYPDCIKGWDSFEMIKKSNADIIIELSYTDLTTGDPAYSHIKTAFENNKHVVTSNKGPSALHHSELTEIAKSRNVFYKIEGTVMSGTPVINTAQKSLAGCTINRIKGILNGTTNYILSRMENGEEYSDVLKEAIRLGYAEADPTGDVEGWDVVAKIVILANTVIGENISIEQVKRKGITDIRREAVEKAKADGFRWKLIGEIERKNEIIEAKVLPQLLPIDDPLASVMGNTNAITFETDLMGPITVIGAGAGKKETGFSILTDILEINNHYSY